MAGVKAFLLKQYNIPLIGELKTTANSVSFYISGILLINTAPTSYTVLRAWLELHMVWILPWLSLPVFIALEFVVLIPLILLVQYKFGLRSEFRFGNIQSFNESPVKPILERIEKRQDAMQVQLDRIERREGE